MNRFLGYIRKHAVMIGLIAVIIAMSVVGSYRETHRASEPALTAENVARFYTAGTTGLIVTIKDVEDVSVELGAEKAYSFTVTAEGFKGEATVVVAATEAGGWVVVPQAQS